MSRLSEAPTKEMLREQFRAYRTHLAPEAVAAKSTAILRGVQALPEVRHAQTVHCYWPLVERGEIDTRPLIRTLHERGVCVVLPVVDGVADGAPRLQHRRYEGPEALCTNRWNLHEPVGTEAVVPETLDLVIVPALGVGRNGHRIGHGYGYYDAFLASLDVPTVALVYDACLVDDVPAEAHDVPVSVIVTERRCLRRNRTADASSAHPSLDSNG